MSTILRKMNVISRCGGAYRADRLETSDLPAFQHSFLTAVCHHPGFSQDQLARHLCLNKSTVTRRLTSLEENGYVTRVPSENDKRVTLVYPTEKAQMLLPKIAALTHEWNDAITDGIPADELAVFNTVLSKLAHRAKELAGMDDDNGGTV